MGAAGLGFKAPSRLIRAFHGPPAVPLASALNNVSACLIRSPMAHIACMLA
jgi:hypothetical protein